jgi:hypothetical protein
MGVIIQTNQKEFQDKADIKDLMRAALISGFKYEFAQYANSNSYLVRVYSDEGELTGTFSKEEMLSLGMEV